MSKNFPFICLHFAIEQSAMREAMANAIVGDDVFGEDPTVQELEQKSAQLFGKEAGLFVCSGTMGNLISIMCHCKYRGSELIVGQSSHVFLYEQGYAYIFFPQFFSTIFLCSIRFFLQAVQQQLQMCQ